MAVGACLAAGAGGEGADLTEVQRNGHWKEKNSRHCRSANMHSHNLITGPSAGDSTHPVWRRTRRRSSACRGSQTPAGAWGRCIGTWCWPGVGGSVLPSLRRSPTAPEASWRPPVRKSFRSPGRKRRTSDGEPKWAQPPKATGGFWSLLLFRRETEAQRARQVHFTSTWTASAVHPRASTMMATAASAVLMVIRLWFFSEPLLGSSNAAVELGVCIPVVPGPPFEPFHNRV